MKNPFRDSTSQRTTSPNDISDAGLTASAPHSSEASSLDGAPSATTRPARRARRGTGAFVAGGLALALVGGGTAVYADAHKSVTLDVDGTMTTVSTFSGSVAGVLAEQGITVGDADLVAPSSNAALSENAEIVVRYAREITLEQDGVVTQVTTTAVDADELLEAYASRGDVRLVASRSDSGGRTDLGLRLSIDGPVDLLLDGAVTPVADGSVGLDTILTDNDVVLGELDRVSVQHLPTPEALQAQARAAELDAQRAAEAAALDAAPADPAAADPAAADPAAVEPATVPSPAPTSSAPADVIADPRIDDTQLTIVVNRVAVADQGVDTPIPFETVTEEDPTRFADLPVATKVEGVDGVQTAVYSVTTVDGVEEARTLLSDTTTVAPVTNVLVQGTKERPKVVVPKVSAPKVSAPSSSAPSADAPAEPAPAAVSGDVWSRLAQCESGGRATVVSSNGKYHGLYQFSVATWQGLGGVGLPSQASAAEQTRLAQALQARSGWGQWPACSSKLGLR